MPVVALDVGYSNLKVAHGPRGADPRVLVRPAGAAPAPYVDQAVRNPAVTGVVAVEINGRPWIAGIEPSRFEGWNRSLHADYPASDAYLALVRAALALTDERYFDLLVTGLPVSQADDAQRVTALRQRLLGRHVLGVDSGVTVDIAEVHVLPQPVGALMDLVVTAEDGLLDQVEEGVVLVIDTGFYSFDWALPRPTWTWPQRSSPRACARPRRTAHSRSDGWPSPPRRRRPGRSGPAYWRWRTCSADARRPAPPPRRRRFGASPVPVSATVPPP